MLLEKARKTKFNSRVRVIYFKVNVLVVFMSQFYYKGMYKVKVVTESEGYLIVEALENFTDCIEGKSVTVKAGERRIVPLNDLVKRDTLPPMVPEHAYELRLEKKVKRMLKKYENEKSNE
jgi:hypothetical protein